VTVTLEPLPSAPESTETIPEEASAAATVDAAEAALPEASLSDVTVAEPAQEASAATPAAPPETAPAAREASHRGHEAPRHVPSAHLGPRLPAIVRPQGLVRPPRPGEVPQPQHAHLPGWVRRVHGQAAPILADLLGSLEGEMQKRYDGEVRALLAGISAGRFSLAWQYPGLIDRGQTLLEAQRREAEAEAARRRSLEDARRKINEQLRDAGTHLAPDTATRLQRTLRSAGDVDTVKTVGSELDRAVTVARTVEERRRDKEIDRTRERIRRSLPRSAAADTPAETWQDALRRIADQYARP
jgi:hypothetical protein